MTALGWHLHAGPSWVASLRFRAVVLLLLSFHPRVGLTRVFSLREGFGLPATGLGHFRSHGQSSITTTSAWDEGGLGGPPFPCHCFNSILLLLLLRTF